MGSTFTSYDRVLSVAGSGKPDRVPVLTYSNHFQVRWAGYNYGEVMEVGDRFVQAQLKALDHFCYDGVTNLGGPGMIADALGASLLVPENESPSMTEPGLTEDPVEIDLKKIRARSITSGNYVPFVLEVTENLRDALGSGIPLIASISSPFREACLIRGFENLFRDLVLEPNFVDDLVELMTDKVYEYAELVSGAGADILGITDPFANQQMISLSRFRNIVLPSERKIISRIHENTDAKVLFHTCGEWGDRFDLALGANADIYHVDRVEDKNIQEIVEMAGEEVGIMGRLPTTELLLDGNPEEVRKAARRSIELAGSAGNYILGGNCSLSPETPPKNLEAMVGASREYGRYPIGKSEGIGSEEVYSP